MYSHPGREIPGVGVGAASRAGRSPSCRPIRAPQRLGTVRPVMGVQNSSSAAPPPPPVTVRTGHQCWGFLCTKLNVPLCSECFSHFLQVTYKQFKTGSYDRVRYFDNNETQMLTVQLI